MDKINSKLITQEEYLATERIALEKHEFFEGQIFEMSPKSYVHTIILGNVTYLIHTQLKKTVYRVYGSIDVSAYS